jgi:DNA processing protein
MGPARQLALLRRWTPSEAWRRVLDRSWLGDRAISSAATPDPGALADVWAREASTVDVAAMWSRYIAAEVGVAAFGSPAYPAPLADDIEPPATLFVRGDPSVIAGPRVAIVGTRSATRYGVDVAYEFGRGLSDAGVAVVSGLALGIDGAAHAGALASGTTAPIAVVGSGLDIIYPKRHASLWRQVERRGVVLSEAPLGAPPERWRFPARNRLIAALADIVVVVESQEHGGSMHTVNEAARRARPVFAVPGPVRSPASVGTNRLLHDGAAPACDVADVLLGLGLSAALQRDVRDPRPPAQGNDRIVLEALRWQPASLEQLASRTELPLGELSLALLRLADARWVEERGGWYERVARPE